jgi:hypothetical protein
MSPNPAAPAGNMEKSRCKAVNISFRLSAEQPQKGYGQIALSRWYRLAAKE